MQESKDERTSEIAAAVQAGKADILSLWTAVERFAWQQSLRWARAMEGRAGVEESDLLQVAFIALMDTLPTWDVNKGEFLTLYGIKLKAEFTEACGQRTQRTRCDPINTVCRSMDEPISQRLRAVRSSRRTESFLPCWATRRAERTSKRRFRPSSRPLWRRWHRAAASPSM